MLVGIAYWCPGHTIKGAEPGIANRVRLVYGMRSVMKNWCQYGVRGVGFGMLLPLLAGLFACAPAPMVGMVASKMLEKSKTKAELSGVAQPDQQGIVKSNVELGIYYLGRGEYQRALERLDRAEEAQSDYPMIYNVRALVRQALGEPELAEDNFRRALSLARSDAQKKTLVPRVKNNYAQFLCAEQRYAEAESLFVEVAENPQYEGRNIAYANMGFCLHRQNRMEAAKGYMLKALELDEAMPAVYLRLCELVLDMGEHAQARRYLEKYREYALHTPKSLWLGIRIEQVLGDEDALASYMLLLRNKFPDSMEARQHFDLSGCPVPGSGCPPE